MPPNRLDRREALVRVLDRYAKASSPGQMGLFGGGGDPPKAQGKLFGRSECGAGPGGFQKGNTCAKKGKPEPPGDLDDEDILLGDLPEAEPDPAPKPKPRPAPAKPKVAAEAREAYAKSQAKKSEPERDHEAEAFEEHFATPFRQAFDKIDRLNKYSNFLRLSDLRKEMPHLPRERFDAGLKRLRAAGEITFDSDDGAISAEEREAGLKEGRETLTRVARTDEGKRKAASVPAKATPARATTPEDVGSLRKAFDKLDRATNGRGLVRLVDLRQESGLDRDAFDAAMHRLRLDDVITLDSHEGRHGPLKPDEMDAAIREAGSILVYASRRSS